MPLAKLPDADIHLDITGSGPPILLVSGLGGVASYWDPNVEGLAARFTVVRYDHRGCGGSTRTEGETSVEAMADDLVALMDAIGLDRAVLLGHSTGGAIGQVVAARTPARIAHLVLYASWAVLCPQMRQCLALRKQALRLAGPAAYHRASPVFLYPPRYTCENWPVLEREWEGATRGTTTASILEARLDAIMAFDGTPYLPRVTAPTTVMVADDDILTPPLASDVLVAGIEGAVLKRFAYGAHAVSRVEPAAFDAAVLDALAVR